MRSTTLRRETISPTSHAAEIVRELAPLEDSAMQARLTAYLEPLPAELRPAVRAALLPIVTAVRLQQEQRALLAEIEAARRSRFARLWPRVVQSCSRLRPARTLLPFRPVTLQAARPIHLPRRAPAPSSADDGHHRHARTYLEVLA